MDAQNRQREYLLKATECERSASETLDPIAAKTYRDMARQWRVLAAQTFPRAFAHNTGREAGSTSRLSIPFETSARRAAAIDR